MGGHCVGDEKDGENASAAGRGLRRRIRRQVLVAQTAQRMTSTPRACSAGICTSMALSESGQPLT